MYNLTTYPHLVGLLEALGVDTEPSEMSFALSMDRGALEWGSHSLDTIFAQRSNLFSLSFWRMIFDVVRFGRQAPKVSPVSELVQSRQPLGPTMYCLACHVLHRPWCSHSHAICCCGGPGFATSDPILIQ